MGAWAASLAAFRLCRSVSRKEILSSWTLSPAGAKVQLDQLVGSVLPTLVFVQSVLVSVVVLLPEFRVLGGLEPPTAVMG